MPNDDIQDEAPGWQAIDAALSQIYGAKKPLHYGTILRHRLGGPDPLDGISAYSREDPILHWHFVTYGLSELYRKESDDPNTSGYGFELTFRLARRADESTSPSWTLNFLQNLARYVFSTGNTFDPEHYLNLNGPISIGSDTMIRVITFDLDPELGEIDTPHGHLRFLQIVGITLDEERAIKGWNARGFLDLLKQENPLMVTDLQRSSLLNSTQTQRTILMRSEAEGSSTGTLYVTVALWKVSSGLLGRKRAVITIGARGVADLKLVLPRRISHNLGLAIVSRDSVIGFQPGEPAWAVEENSLVVKLTPQLASELSNVLQAKAGMYRVPSLADVVIRVEKSTITNGQGEVVETIG